MNYLTLTNTKKTSKRQNRYIKASDKNDGQQPIRCSIKLLLVGKSCQCVINDMKNCPRDTVVFLMCDELNRNWTTQGQQSGYFSTDDFMVHVTQVDSHHCPASGKYHHQMCRD